jgi:hypothetical protein
LRIGDPEAGIGVDEQALLVGREDFLVGHFKIEQALLDAVDAVDEGHAEIQAGVGFAAGRVDRADRLTRADDHDLVFFGHHIGAHHETDHQHCQRDDRVAVILQEIAHVTGPPVRSRW